MDDSEKTSGETSDCPSRPEPTPSLRSHITLDATTHRLIRQINGQLRTFSAMSMSQMNAHMHAVLTDAVEKMKSIQPPPSLDPKTLVRLDEATRQAIAFKPPTIPIPPSRW